MASTSIISGGASTPRQSYRVDQGRTIWIRQGRSGSPEDVLLANFSARVIEEIHVEDGRGTQVYFRVEAVLDGEARVVCLSAAQFRDMRWVEEYLGAGAIVESGYGFRDHLRAAFLHFSGDRRITSEYRHVGWREIDGQAVYLTASGGIGADGARPDVHVVPPPALHHLILPCSESEEAARAAVLASLELRQLGPARLLHPLLATVRRSILGDADFSAALIGKSGEFKTAVAVVMQQHFGSGFNERQVPGSAESTANALEESLHQAKDMLFVIDDIAPQANSDAARAQH
ncbi:MAG: hypothetical protein IT460_05020, partial [Planctomycetes bacterium]|nr:hypothetical protein [Planctomycetota bacterium]